MLSANPAVPLHKINFADTHRRRLSLVDAHGRELYTAHDGLPSPEALTPVTGGNTPGLSPLGGSPAGSPGISRRTSQVDSAPISRRPSDSNLLDDDHGPLPDGGRLTKVPSRGGLWHDEVSL